MFLTCTTFFPHDNHSDCNLLYFLLTTFSFAQKRKNTKTKTKKKQKKQSRKCSIGSHKQTEAYKGKARIL